MRALRFTAPGATELFDLPQPTPGPGDVLLRVRLIGLCGTDLNSFRGRNPLVSYPRIPGHEIAATIAGLGPEVPAQFHPGMDVAVSPYNNCGTCPACLRHRPNACRSNHTLGVQQDGAMADFIVAPWQKLLVGEGLSLRELCLVEPLTVGFHAAARGRVTADDTVAVLGCGAIGLGAISGAAQRGARVIAVDVDAAKLELARRVGASLLVNAQLEPLHDRLQELTSGRGPDVVVEAIGLPETYRSAVEEVAFTGRVVYIGYAKQPVSYETKLFVLKELDLLGARNATVEDFSAVIQMLQQRRFPTDAAVSKVVPLAEAGPILAAWDAHPEAFTKIHIELG